MPAGQDSFLHTYTNMASEDGNRYQPQCTEEKVGLENKDSQPGRTLDDKERRVPEEWQALGRQNSRGFLLGSWKRG